MGAYASASSGSRRNGSVGFEARRVMIDHPVPSKEMRDDYQRLKPRTLLHPTAKLVIVGTAILPIVGSGEIISIDDIRDPLLIKLANFEYAAVLKLTISNNREILFLLDEREIPTAERFQIELDLAQRDSHGSCFVNVKEVNFTNNGVDFCKFSTADSEIMPLGWLPPAPLPAGPVQGDDHETRERKVKERALVELREDKVGDRANEMLQALKAQSPTNFDSIGPAVLSVLQSSDRYLTKDQILEQMRFPVTRHNLGIVIGGLTSDGLIISAGRRFRLARPVGMQDPSWMMREGSEEA